MRARSRQCKIGTCAASVRVAAVWTLVVGAVTAALLVQGPPAQGSPAAVLLRPAWHVVVVLGCYLSAVALLALVGAALRLARVLRIAERLTLGVLRPWLPLALGVGVAVGPAQMVAAHPVEPWRAPASARAVLDAAARPVPAAEGEPDEWLVRPGDHCWGIAEQVLGRSLGRAPQVEEIAAYWRRLVRANDDRFVDGGGPDLIVPGQRLRLPGRPEHMTGGS